MKRVIITGATGAIGTALIQEFINNNVEALVFCRRDSKRISNIPINELVKIKYCSLDELSSVKNNSKKDYDCFYHLGWAGTTGEARNDLKLQLMNVSYTLDAVECAKKFGCKKFVGIGSQAEYGRKNEPLKSSTSCFPENGYGIAKLTAGLMSKQMCEDFNLEYNWVRVLSVFGPKDNSLITYLINELNNDKSPKLTKCEQIWDFLYSEDAARALYMIGEKGLNGKTYVLGSGDIRPLKDYVYELRDIVNPNCKINLGAIPYNDKQVMYLGADIKELKKDLNWMPNIKFSSGIKKILEINKN